MKDPLPPPLHTHTHACARTHTLTAAVVERAVGPVEHGMDEADDVRGHVEKIRFLSPKPR